MSPRGSRRRGRGALSLRTRLVGSMSAVVLLGLLGVGALHGMAEDGTPLARRLGNLLLGDGLPEPFQDLAVLLPFGVATLALVWLVTGWSLRPIAVACDEASRAGPGAPEARIAGRRLPGELSPLVDAMNGALDRLQGAVEAERRFTQDAAHELRTPLACLSLRLQSARRTGRTDWDQIEGELARMGRLVAQLLDLARKDAGPRATAPAPSETVNLARIAREAASSVLPLVESRGRALDIALPRTALLPGRPDDLRDMLRNLLENALHHGRGTIGVRVGDAAPGDPRFLALEIVDEGRGVPAAEREAVFGRFRKGDASGAGSGLGLAIARAVVESHGGSIAFVDAPGADRDRAACGCVVRVMLPAMPGRGAAGGVAP